MKTFWEEHKINYIPRPIEWYSSDDPLAIQYREWMKEKTKETLESMKIPNRCGSCIHLYDEGMITCCMKNKRWVNTKFENECDIDSWEGFNLI